MALNLYRRHRADCEAGVPEDSSSGEFEERKKGWRKCGCTIFASGTLGGQFKRKRTGTASWEEARAIADRWSVAQSWDGGLAPPAVVVPVTIHSDGGRMSLKQATDAYLASRANHGIAGETLTKYRTFVKQLLAYSETQGYLMLDQLTVVDMDKFYASWKDGKRSKARKLNRLKGFVKFCVKRDWLKKDITDDLRAPLGSSTPADKSPFSDAELERIYAICRRLQPVPPGPGHREWSGEDVSDFILLSVYTGLRISDVATFDITKRLNGNDVFLRMHKTKKPLTTYAPDWLVNRLRAREKKYGAMLFRTGESHVMRSIAEGWRTKLKIVFTLAGPFEEPPTPHRFRHTFVRILLEKGVAVADVAELIGDTEQMVRKHYSRWVKTRQDRLTKILQDAFQDRPKLVAIGADSCPRLLRQPEGSSSVDCMTPQNRTNSAGNSIP